MADSPIKLFRSVQIFFEAMGAPPPTWNKTYQFTNLNFLFFSSSMGFTLFILIIYVIFRAASVFDYGIGFYGSITMLAALTLLTIFVWKMKKILKFIEHSEKLIERSK